MKALIALVFAIGLGLALNTASCSDRNNCTGTASSAGAGGASAGTGGSCTTTSASSGAASTCDQLTALQACFTSFCKADGAGTPFCTCFLRGYDLSAAPDCLCVAFNSSAFCAEAEDAGIVASNLDCSAATGPVASQCVGVQ